MGRRVGDRKAEEEPIAELLATTTTQRGARPADAQQARDLRDAPLGGPRSPSGPQSWAARPPRLAAQASARSIAAGGSAAVKYGLRRGKLSARSGAGAALGQSSG